MCGCAGEVGFAGADAGIELADAGMRLGRVFDTGGIGHLEETARASETNAIVLRHHRQCAVEGCVRGALASGAVLR